MAEDNKEPLPEIQIVKNESSYSKNMGDIPPIKSNPFIDYEFEATIEEEFLSGNLSDLSKKDNKEKQDYLSSEYRKLQYREITEKDEEFNSYLRKTYGSVQNYFDFNNEIQDIRTYNPSTDYQVEVSIITNDKVYESNFISKTETILEMLSGVCTVDFYKRDGRISRIMGTLSENYIPDVEQETRFYSFYGLPGDRLLIWDIINKKWSSFYMINMERFVRDDTSGIE